MLDLFGPNSARQTFGVLATIVAVAVVIAIVVAGGGSAQSTGTTRTITLFEKDSDSYNAFIDNKPLSPRSKRGPHISRGDEIAFDDPVLDAQGAAAGHLDVHCADTVPGNFASGAIFACAGGIRLADGTLTLQGVTSVTSKVTNIAITGGTGAYSGVSGSMVSTTESETRSQDVITLNG